MCVIDLLWIRRRILTLFGLQTGAPCLSCGRKILKIDFPSRIASTAPATFSPFFLFFPPSSLFQGFDEAFKGPLLSVGAGEVGTPSPHGPKGTSPTRIRKHFHDCFIHNAPSNGIVWFHACYLRLGWSEPWHSVIGLADPCTAGGIIRPRNLIWFGKDQGMWFDGSYLFFVLDREKVKKRREKKTPCWASCAC